MTATRPYHSPGRQGRRQRTKQAIVEAFIAQLGDPGRAVLSPAAAARAAGVSIRTVHHYFPGADAQLAAVADEVETRLYRTRPRCPARPPSCRTWSPRSTGSPKASCRCCAPWSAAASGAQVRARRRAGRLEAIKTVLEGIGQAQQTLAQGCFGATPAREPVFRSGSGT